MRDQPLLLPQSLIIIRFGILVGSCTSNKDQQCVRVMGLRHDCVRLRCEMTNGGGSFGAHWPRQIVAIVKELRFCQTSESDENEALRRFVVNKKA